MLKALVIVVVLLVAAVLIYAATQPDTFRIERSVRIQAPPDRIFGLVSNLEQFNRWNPWLKKDPGTKGTYSGAASGPGATYAWESGKIGSGRMTIAEANAPGRVTIKLDFIKPFEAHNMAEFTITPDGDGSRVTWAMFGPNTFLSKLIHVFFSMDKMVGGDFEDGLAALKALAEAR
jgi:carbon monoxide dehydrogenase subunit G